MSSPIVAIDHIRVKCRKLAESEAELTELLGFEPIWRGKLAADPSTELLENKAAIFETSNLYLVLQESAGEAGLDQLCLQVDDINRLERRLKQLGISFSDKDAPDPLQKPLDQPSARIISASTDATRGVALSFVARDSRPNRQCINDAHVSGLDHIVINSADAQGTAYMLGAQLGLDMRMDISRPEWGARLMFFRCGDLIVEVFQQLGDDAIAKESDSFYGLSWRVPNADSAKGRLQQVGRDVSDVRKGRKPGSYVFTSRDRNVGVPTLMIQPPIG